MNLSADKHTRVMISVMILYFESNQKFNQRERRFFSVEIALIFLFPIKRSVIYNLQSNISHTIDFQNSDNSQGNVYLNR